MAKPIPTITPNQMPSVLERNAETGDNTFFHGASGIGKTSIVEQFARDQAEKLGLIFWDVKKGDMPGKPEEVYGYIDARVATWDSLDVKGAPITDIEQETTRFLINSVLPNQQRHGMRGLINFDELPQGATSVTNSLSQIFLGGKIGDSYVFPTGDWQICATGNRKQDQAGTNKIGAHIYNRFRNYEVVASVRDLAQYFLKKGSDGRVGGFLRLCEQHVQNYERGDICFGSPRVWEQVDKDVREIEDQEFLTLQVASAVSTPVAAELMGYLAMASQLVTFSTIVKDPFTASVPSPGEPSSTAAMFAIIGMCAGKRLTEDNIEQVAAYVKRLPEEFTTTWMLDVINTHPDLQETVAFTKLRADMGDNAV